MTSSTATPLIRLWMHVSTVDWFDCTPVFAVHHQVTGAGLSIVNAVNGLSNLAGVSTDGFDVGAVYEFDGPWDTRVNMDLQGTYVKENTFAPVAVVLMTVAQFHVSKLTFNANVFLEQLGFRLENSLHSRLNRSRFHR